MKIVFEKSEVSAIVDLGNLINRKIHSLKSAMAGVFGKAPSGECKELDVDTALRGVEHHDEPGLKGRVDSDGALTVSIDSRLVTSYLRAVGRISEKYIDAIVTVGIVAYNAFSGFEAHAKTIITEEMDRPVADLKRELELEIAATAKGVVAGYRNNGVLPDVTVLRLLRRAVYERENQGCALDLSEIHAMLEIAVKLRSKAVSADEIEDCEYAERVFKIATTPVKLEPEVEALTRVQQAVKNLVFNFTKEAKEDYEVLVNGDWNAGRLTEICMALDKLATDATSADTYYKEGVSYVLSGAHAFYSRARDRDVILDEHVKHLEKMLMQTTSLCEAAFN